MYIGKTPTVGNFQVCDAISVVNGQAAYTLQVGGVNVAPESANHMLVSLNGILQKPGSSFTISGSTMTFASNLATGDVIDFVQILGNVLDIGQPSDDTVTAAKINNDVISGQTELAATPADTDELLISDAGTIKRIDVSLVGGKNTPFFYGELASTISNITRATQTKITGMTRNEVDSDTAFDGTTFTVPSGKAGKYYLEGVMTASYGNVGQDGEQTISSIYKNGSILKQGIIRQSSSTGQNMRAVTAVASGIFDLSAGDTIELYAYIMDADSGTADAADEKTSLGGYKLIT